MNRLYRVLIIVNICLVPLGVASSFAGQPKGTVAKVAKVNFAELAARQPPARSAVESVWATHEPRMRPVSIPLLSVNDKVLAGPQPAIAKMQGPGGTFVPEIRTNFAALIDNLTAIPPDTHGAVGPEHLMVALNTEVAVQSRQGAVLTKLPLAQFWEKLAHNVTVDPKILYDHLAQRWIMVTLADPQSASSAVFIAASSSSDPTADWDLASIDVDPQDQVWADFPNIGFNDRWVAVTVNIFGIQTNSFLRSHIFVIDKNELYSEGEIDFKQFDDPGFFTLVPAITFGPPDLPLYLLTENGTRSLRITKIQGAAGDPEYSTNALVTSMVAPWAFSNASTNFPGGTNFSPQLGANALIFANDSRLQSCLFRNGNLWTVHHIFLPAGTNLNRTAIQWWQLSTNGTIMQRGLIDDPTGQVHYTFPSLSVNKLNDVLIGYSRFSPTQYASASFSFRLAGDPLHTLRAETLLKAGLAPYNRPNPRGRNSWGDFSSTVVDPLNDVDMWTIQEYAELPQGETDRWGTWWGYLGFQPEIPPTITSEPQSQKILVLGTNITLTASATGTPPLSYQWRLNGTNLSGATGPNLVLSDFQPENTGDYSLVVSNVAGYAVSARASLLLAPPEITSQPQSQTLAAGANATLTVVASGTAPLAYQWKFNGTNIDGAINPTLELSNFQEAHTGIYLVAISNPAGSIASAEARLSIATVRPPQFADFRILPDNSFQTRLLSDSQVRLVIETSTNLISWTQLVALVNENGRILIKDQSAANFNQRFYRLRTD